MLGQSYLSCTPLSASFRLVSPCRETLCSLTVSSQRVPRRWIRSVPLEFDVLVVSSHLPSTLVVLLLQADGPVVEACVGAVVHAEDNRSAQDHPWRAAAHHGAEQGLAAGQG